MKKIIKNRYPSNLWNIFGVQISDGDNWPSDNEKAVALMNNFILPTSQYFAYVEVSNTDFNWGGDSDLKPHYEILKEKFRNLEIATISDVTEIYPVFRSLFEKRDSKT